MVRLDENTLSHIYAKHRDLVEMLKLRNIGELRELGTENEEIA